MVSNFKSCFPQVRLNIQYLHLMRCMGVRKIIENNNYPKSLSLLSQLQLKFNDLQQLNIFYFKF